MKNGGFTIGDLRRLIDEEPDDAPLTCGGKSITGLDLTADYGNPRLNITGDPLSIDLKISIKE